jgi:GNAT superfamily N-acetyltransferase
MLMPRTVAEILEQADDLAARFEAHEPDTTDVHDAAALRAVREAFQSRAQAERLLADAVSAARTEGHSWSAIGVMVGTSGEAARQRYGRTASKR